ncbi:MAG TPA: hypothetical protein VF010_09160 [Methylomirabilota bacterium]|nr:hypothetical protein [Methylomirabilota bacterium]
MSTTVPVTAGAPVAGTTACLAILGRATVCRPDEAARTVVVAPPVA